MSAKDLYSFLKCGSSPASSLPRMYEQASSKQKAVYSSSAHITSEGLSPNCLAIAMTFKTRSLLTKPLQALHTVLSVVEQCQKLLVCQLNVIGHKLFVGRLDERRRRDDVNHVEQVAK